MTPPLFLIDASLAAARPGERLQLLGDEGRHAARVKRLAVGEAILVGDGLGSVADCLVSAVLPDGLELLIRDVRTVAPPAVRIGVAQALPKGDRAELAVEVMTELGVDVILPWAASRSIVQWQGARGAKALEKWRSTSREATKQSRRPTRPEVTELVTTAALAARIAAADAALVLHEAAEESIADVDLPTAGEVLLVVGPEGGISDTELEAFTAAGASVVRMGPEVLRTSTAGAAGLAAMALRLGRWR